MATFLQTPTLRWLTLAALSAALTLIGCAQAFAYAPGPERYGEGVTTNVTIPMRDGVELSADVHYPTRPDGSAAKGPFPVLVSETPYGKETGTASQLGGLEGDQASEVRHDLDTFAGHRPYLVKRGYIQVIVDVRGTGGSDGSFQLFGPEELADSRQVIAWAAKLPHSTGKVGMTGESYLGIDQLFAAGSAGKHSPLKAIFPMIAANDPYRDLLTSGGLFNIESTVPLAAVYGVLPIANPALQAGLDPSVLAQVPGLVDDRVRDVLEGFSVPTMASILTGGDRAYEGSYWSDARRPADYLRRIVRNRIPAYLVGGLYDVFQRGEPLNYSGLQNAWAGRPTEAPMAPRQQVTGRYQLFMRPQYHMTIDHGAPSLDRIQLRWFDRWLKGKRTGIAKTTRPLHVVQPDHERFDVARFPLDQARTHAFYLGAGGTLTRTKPEAAGSDALAFAGVSLPCDRSSEQWGLGVLELALQPLGLGDPCAGQDIVPSSAGPGQIVYTTPPLKAARTLAGPISARIYATANTRDTEWVAKLSDVAPDGTSTDLTQGALLGSHRQLDPSRTWYGRGSGRLPILPWHPHTKAAKKSVVPGELTRYDIEIRSMFATLPAGHRLRLTLLSSQSPHLIPLPEDLLNLVGGVYSVHHGPTAPSSLQVPLARPDSLARRAH